MTGGAAHDPLAGLVSTIAGSGRTHAAGINVPFSLLDPSGKLFCTKREERMIEVYIFLLLWFTSFLLQPTCWLELPTGSPMVFIPFTIAW